MSGETTYFDCVKVITEVEKDNQKFLLPHYRTKQDSEEFNLFTFYATSTTTINEGEQFINKFKKNKFICFNEKLAKKLKAQLEQNITHFSGYARLSNFNTKVINDNKEKPHYFYENFEYIVVCGDFLNKPYIDGENQKNSKFTNYSSKQENNNTSITEEKIEDNTPEIDDEMPF